MAKHYRMLIGGAWVDGAAGSHPIINPATEEVVGEAPQASVEQAEAAAAAGPGGVARGGGPPPGGRGRPRAAGGAPQPPPP
ncbi:MAG: hypothetical protein LH616_12085, partial [Ilumatobacteraceae bacterium]|nr:hypothetical protein [Ilumatobacteraceae bacterium]